MSDHLRPITFRFNPLRINQRGEGHGRNQQEGHEQNGNEQGKQQKQPKKPSVTVNLNSDRELSDFEKLLRGER